MARLNKKVTALSVLTKMMQECASDMTTVGIPIHAERVYEITIRPIRGTRALIFGGINAKDGLMYFSICIHNAIRKNLDNEYAMANIKNSIYHELLHTCDNCFSHNAKWMKWSRCCDKHLGTYTRLHMEEDVYYDADAACITYVCPTCGGEYRATKEHEAVHCCFCKADMNRLFD